MQCIEILIRCYQILGGKKIWELKWEKKTGTKFFILLRLFRKHVHVVNDWVTVMNTNIGARVYIFMVQSSTQMNSILNLVKSAKIRLNLLFWINLEPKRILDHMVPNKSENGICNLILVNLIITRSQFSSAHVRSQRLGIKN